MMMILQMTMMMMTIWGWWIHLQTVRTGLDFEANKSRSFRRLVLECSSLTKVSTVTKMSQTFWHHLWYFANLSEMSVSDLGVTNIQIFSDTNIHLYHIHIIFWYECIRIFLVCFFIDKYIWIFVCIKTLYSSHPVSVGFDACRPNCFRIWGLSKVSF